MNISSPKECFVVIDAGTTHIKATILTTQGQVIASAWRPSALYRPQPLWCEQDLDETWASVLACIREATSRAALQPGAFAALVITAQGDGTRLLKVDGSPVRRAIIWQDNRAAGLIERWQDDGRAQAVAQFTGTALCGSHQTAQLAWLRLHEPEALAQTWKIFFAKDWLLFRLTGVVGTEQTDAGHIYLDVRQGRVEPRILELLDLADLAEKLPPVLDAHDLTGPLKAEWAEAVGLPAGLPVLAAPIDLACELLGVGGFAAGAMCSVMGTAGIHQVVVEALPQGAVGAGDTVRLPQTPLWIRFIPTMLAMPNIDFWANLLYSELSLPREGVAGWAEIEDRVSVIPPGAEGVLYLPFLSPAGERSPRLAPDARAHFSGISLLHTRDHLMRAVYEGLVTAAVNAFAHLPAASGELLLAGGGARSKLLAQLLADALGRPVRAYEGAGARGALVYGSVILGLHPTYESAFSAINAAYQRFLPSPTSYEIYRSLFTRYRAEVEAGA